jgi:hypothetical protein
MQFGRVNAAGENWRSCVPPSAFFKDHAALTGRLALRNFEQPGPGPGALNLAWAQRRGHVATAAGAGISIMAASPLLPSRSCRSDSCDSEESSVPVTVCRQPEDGDLTW